MPSIVCGGILLWSRRRRNPALPATLGGGTLVALALAVIAIPTLLHVKHGSASYVWAMGGDSRNNVMAARSVLESGGLSLDELRTSPSAINALVALVLSANGHADLSPAAMLTRDIQGYSGMWVLTALGLAVLSATAVILSLPDHIHTRSRLSGPLGIVVFSSGLVVGTGLFAGVALQDGFLNAFGGEVLLMAGVVVAIRALQRPHPLLGLLLLGDTFALAVYRPLLTPVVMALFLAVLVRVFARHGWSLGWWPVASVAMIMIVAFGAYIATAGKSQLAAGLSAPGSVAAPHPWLLPALGLLALALVLGPRPASPVSAAAPILIVLASLMLLARWADSQDPAQALPGVSYSAAKLVWAACMVGVWLIFACIGRVVAKPVGPSVGWLGQLRPVALASSVCVAALLAITIASPLGSPVPSMLKGTSRPTPEVIDALLANLHDGSIVVPWLYSDLPGVGGVRTPDFANDRLAIFWSMTQWGALYPQFYAWAYFSIGDGNAFALCPLVQAAPRLVILTRDPALSQREQTACGPTENVRFIVESPSAG